VKLQVERKPLYVQTIRYPDFVQNFPWKRSMLYTSYEKGMRIFQRKFVWGLFHAEKYRPLRIVPTSVEIVIPLIHHSVDPFCRKLPRP
jgi:hypothetical protein